MPVRARGLGALCLGIALASAARPAAAQTLELEIDWSGECAPAQGLPAQVARLLRGAGGAYPPLEVEIEAERRSDAEILLSLELDGEGFAAKRELTVGSCDDAHAAAALLIALALDPEAVSPDELKAPDEPEPEPEPDDEKPSPAETGPKGFGLELALGVLGDSSSLPAPTLAPELGFGAVAPLGPGDISLRFSGRIYLSRERAQTLADGERATTSLGLVSGELAGCYALREGRLRFGPCAAIELGRIHGAPQQIEDGRAGAALWAAASGGILGALWLGPRLALEVSAAVGIPLRRPRFASHREGDLFRVRQVTGRAALHIIYRF